MKTTYAACPECGKIYILGVEGTIDGCDKCKSVTRNPLDHTIIEEDTMTDMEKA